MFPEPSSLPARDSCTNIVVRCGIHRTRCYGHPDVVQGERLLLTSFINITFGAVHSRSSAGAAREAVPTVHRRAGQAVSGRHKPRSTVQEMLRVSPSSPPLPGCVPVRSHSASRYTRARHRRLIRTVFRPDAVYGPHTGRLHWICTRGRAVLAVHMGRTHGALIG
ncbi:hypothetical protein B0H11DRAFT_331721 [Mycena galericulata]|nr:hypothetical protein B0H11DRAFT_331721 [Mycena galericulata]